MTWLIKNRRTGKYVYGTNYRRNPPTQKTSFEKALLFETLDECELSMAKRRCGRDYEARYVYICEHCEHDWC